MTEPLSAQPTQAAQPVTLEPVVPPVNKKRKMLPLFILLAFALLGLYGAYYYFTVYRYIEKTDNAYVKADVTWVLPRVSGEVTKLYVQANQKIVAGQMLLQLDDRDLKARYAQAQAITRAKEAGLNVQAQNERVQQAAMAEAQAGLVAAKADEARLVKDYARYTLLLKDGVTTRQRVEAVQAQYIAAQAQVARAQAAIESVKAQLAGSRATREQLQADLSSSQANVDAVNVDATSSQVVAPIAGTIGSLGVRLGSRVTPQTRLMAIVPLQSAYVEANFKETQIGKMRIGQKVTIRLDAYPAQEFHGHVESFAPASGAEFSLLPPDNATGNFNKVVQRLPVRIHFDDLKNDSLLRPGLSATVEVDLRSGTQDKLAQAASSS